MISASRRLPSSPPPAPSPREPADKAPGSQFPVVNLQPSDQVSKNLRIPRFFFFSLPFSQASRGKFPDPVPHRFQPSAPTHGEKSRPSSPAPLQDRANPSRLGRTWLLQGTWETAPRQEKTSKARGESGELSHRQSSASRGGSPRPLSARKEESCKQPLCALPRCPSSGCNFSAPRGCAALPGTAGAPHAVNNIPLFPSGARFTSRQLRSDLGLISTVDAGM